MKYIALPLLLFCSQVMAGDRPPTINLLPPTVREDIQQTNLAARAIEGKLKTQVARLDTQYRTYQAAQCDPLSNDVGCQQIASAMASTYQDLLDQLDDALPDLKRSLQSMRDDLQLRLRHELGMRRTPRQLQALVADEANNSMSKPGKQQGKTRTLTDGVRSLASLLPRFSGASTGTVAASTFYLDSVAAVDAITFIEGQIPYARTQIALNEAWGGLDGAVIESVRGFTHLYYGEAEDESLPDNPLQVAGGDSFDAVAAELTDW